MEKKDKESYESRTALGRIYRMIDKSEYENFGRTQTWARRFDDRLKTQGIERYLEEARHVRDRYNRDLTSLMNQYGLRTEAEAISGFVVEWTKRSSVHRSTHELQQQLQEAVRRLKREYTDEFDREFEKAAGGRIADDVQQQMQIKAAAWYHVTYDEDELRQNTSSDAHLLSFPWVVAHHLCDLAIPSHRRAPAELVSQARQLSIHSHSTGHRDVPLSARSAHEEEEDDDEDKYDEDDEYEEDDDDDTNVITLEELRGRAPGRTSNNVRANATEEELSDALLGKNA